MKGSNSFPMYSCADLSFNIRELTARVPFPVENTKITLFIYNDSRQSLGKGPVRKLLFDAYTHAANIIDIAGDGIIPAAAIPYQVVTPGAYIRVTSEKAGVEKLKWSDFKDALWGLREYMVVQGHLYAIRFEIFRIDDGVFYLADGRVDLASGSQVGHDIAPQ